MSVEELKQRLIQLLEKQQQTEIIVLCLTELLKTKSYKSCGVNSTIALRKIYHRRARNQKNLSIPGFVDFLDNLDATNEQFILIHSVGEQVGYFVFTDQNISEIIGLLTFTMEVPL